MQKEQEFLDLLTVHQGILMKVCNMYVRHPQDREDLFQEMSLNAWKGYANFKGDARFSTWLYRVALNTAITFHRKRKRAPETYEAIELADEPASEPDQTNAMYSAISELPEIDKALVMLYLDDHDHNEISQILGISINNVAVKLNRIKAKLRTATPKFITN